MGDGIKKNTPYEEFRALGTGRERVRREEAVRLFKQKAAIIERAHENLIENAQNAAKHHPEIDQQVFRDLIAAYEAETPAMRKRQEEILNNHDPKTLELLDLEEARRDFIEKVRARMEPKHGLATDAAMHAIAEERQPESIFTPLARVFYNTDRGGPQWGALLTASLGGGMAYFLSSSADSSPLMTLGITALATLVTAYAGNQIFPGKETTPTPNFRVPAPEKAKTISKEADAPETAVSEKKETAMPVARAPIEGVKEAPLKTEPSAPYTPPPASTTPEIKLPGR